MNKIYPCLGMDNQLKNAIELYAKVFDQIQIHFQSDMVANLEIDGVSFMFLNGGPDLKVNPCISFFVKCNSIAEINRKWKILSKNGIILMDINTYSWAERYGCIQDQFGVNWQLIHKGAMEKMNQKIIPCLMFVQENAGKAEEALKFYTSIFDHSEIIKLESYTSEDNDTEGYLKHGQFQLAQSYFTAMDSSHIHEFQFSHGNSFVVECKGQKEVDFLWDTFVLDGGEEGRCGWLKDKFGISWQIIPKRFLELANSSDPDIAKRVFQAMAPMNKLIEADFEKAAKG